MHKIKESESFSDSLIYGRYNTDISGGEKSLKGKHTFPRPLLIFKLIFLNL